MAQQVNGAVKKTAISNAERIATLEAAVAELTWYHAGLSWFIQQLIAAQVAAQAAPNVQAEIQKQVQERLAQGFGG
jgi:hypothetical protein